MHVSSMTVELVVIEYIFKIDFSMFILICKQSLSSSFVLNIKTMIGLPSIRENLS